MPKGRDQTRSAEHPQRPFLLHVDDHRVIWLTVADKRDHAAGTSIGLPHPAVVTTDGDVAHGRIISGGCDNARPGTVLAVVHAFVLIDAQPHRVADLAEELAGIEGVSEVYSVAGHADIVAVVRVRQHDELAEVVTRRMSNLDGILDTRTLIAFQAYSQHDLDAMWDLGQ
jgi:DNA-binding Lrp family transcriptional regulator